MALLTIDQLLKAFPESARKKLSCADLHEACKRLNEQLPEVSAYIDHIDLLKDELQRIECLTTNTEIKGLCERGLRLTQQNIPVIQQRDDAERKMALLRVELEDLCASHNAETEGAPTLDQHKPTGGNGASLQ